MGDANKIYKTLLVMRYTYAYKTSDGKRHEASMEAASREAVFEALRARGIKAITVVAADGSKANGATPVDGVRLRYLLYSLLAFAVLFVSSVLFVSFFPVRQAPADAASQSFLTSRTRRQVIGDAAIIEKGVATGWAGVFGHEGERFLASFAIPGVKAGQRSTTVEEMESALSRRVEPSPDDGIEARQIISMVEGMKAEARAYVAAGGSIVEYGRRLTERQDAEIAVYERAKADFEAAKRAKKSEDELVAYWESLNDRLRNLGVKLVPLE